jgi:hypothetical protein
MSPNRALLEAKNYFLTWHAWRSYLDLPTSCKDHKILEQLERIVSYGHALALSVSSLWTAYAMSCAVKNPKTGETLTMHYEVN